MKKLNLGCGKDIRKGYINLDLKKLPGVDIVHNINKKFPFKTNSFDEIYASHILEHVDDLIFTMEELHWKFLNLISILINLFPILYSRYFSFILPSNEIYVKMRAVK